MHESLGFVPTHWPMHSTDVQRTPREGARKGKVVHESIVFRLFFLFPVTLPVASFTVCQFSVLARALLGPHERAQCFWPACSTPLLVGSPSTANTYGRIPLGPVRYDVRDDRESGRTQRSYVGSGTRCLKSRTMPIYTFQLWSPTYRASRNVAYSAHM